MAEAPAAAALVVDISRKAVLGIYRSLLREAETLPTATQRAFVRNKTRASFRKNKKLTKQEDIELEVRLALSHIDSIQVQSSHLKKYFYDDRKEVQKQQQEREMQDAKAKFIRENVESWRQPGDLPEKH